MNWLILNDRRIWIALAYFAFAGIATACCYINYPALADVSTFLGAVFASWVAGLVLTLGLTSILFVLQLPRADLDPFETRAKNFLQGQKGPHVDYAVRQLGVTLRPYCVRLEKTLTVVDYDEVQKIFYVNMQTTNVLKGYLSDRDPDYSGKVEYQNATISNKDEKPNRLQYLKINGTEQGKPENFIDSVSREYVTEIIPGKECKIEHRMSFWLKENDEANRHKPTRFTNSIDVQIKNESNFDLLVRFFEAEKVAVEIEIPVSESRPVFSCKSKMPGEFVYDFRLCKG